jgi:hypothetical protein
LRSLSGPALALAPGDADLVGSLEEEFKYETDDAKEKKTFEQLSETRSNIEELGFKVRQPSFREQPARLERARST